MRIIIRHLSGSDAGKRQVFRVRPLLLGRDSDCDVQFNLRRDLEVSGRHAEIVPGPQGIEIVDLDSTNGVLVNDTEVQRHPLTSGDEIELGPGGPRLRFELKRAYLRSFLSRLFGGK